jgi:hypothetical protein
MPDDARQDLIVLEVFGEGKTDIGQECISCLWFRAVLVNAASGHNQNEYRILDILRVLPSPWCLEPT